MVLQAGQLLHEKHVQVLPTHHLDGAICRVVDELVLTLQAGGRVIPLDREAIAGVLLALRAAPRERRRSRGKAVSECAPARLSSPARLQRHEKVKRGMITATGGRCAPNRVRSCTAEGRRRAAKGAATIFLLFHNDSVSDDPPRPAPPPCVALLPGSSLGRFCSTPLRLDTFILCAIAHARAAFPRHDRRGGYAAVFTRAVYRRYALQARTHSFIAPFQPLIFYPLLTCVLPFPACSWRAAMPCGQRARVEIFAHILLHRECLLSECSTLPCRNLAR